MKVCRNTFDDLNGFDIKVNVCRNTFDDLNGILR